jgi:2'-5' RNA ligase
MSPRRRLGVALLLDPPWSTEVEGLRRALGDSSLGLVAPHLTLVPPINVRSGDLGNALDIVRRSAAAAPGPLLLRLGPVATFMPTNPVVYLTVSGPSMASLRRLREGILAGPLLRPDRWPWVPHVTLADQSSPEQAEAALVALRHYQSEATFDRVVIMEQRERRWEPLSDAELGPPAVVGRGGLELEITAGRVIGPDALGLVEAGSGAQAPPPEAIVLIGRRAGLVVGVAFAWQDGTVGAGVRVCVSVEAGARGQGVGRAVDGAQGYGPAGFFTASSAWIRDVRPPAEMEGWPPPS